MTRNQKQRMLATDRARMAVVREHLRSRGIVADPLRWLCEKRTECGRVWLNNNKHWHGFQYTAPFNGWYCYGACRCRICATPRDHRPLRFCL